MNGKNSIKAKAKKFKDQITKQDWDDFIARCISRGWTVRTLKKRPPFGKHHKTINWEGCNVSK